MKGRIFSKKTQRTERILTDFINNKQLGIMKKLTLETLKKTKKKRHKHPLKRMDTKNRRKKKHKSNLIKKSANKSNSNVKKRTGFLPPQINNQKRGPKLRKINKYK